METLFKIRFIPFVFGVVTLAAGLLLKFVFQIHPNFNIIKLGIFLTVAGFIYLRLMQDIAKQKNKKGENPEPVKTIKEIKTEETKNEIYNLKNRNIPFSIIRIFFGIIIVLFGINLIFEEQIIFGLILLVFGIFANILSFNWTIKYFKRLKELKKESNNE